MAEVTVDFVVKDPWRMVLVEEGPWEDVSSNLHRVQDRLYACIDAAIQGKLAEQFPESKGADITVQLDCYSLPQEPVSQFFQAFSSGALELPIYKESLQAATFVASVNFAISFA
jgi:hypothetical protein